MAKKLNKSYYDFLKNYNKLIFKIKDWSFVVKNAVFGLFEEKILKIKKKKKNHNVLVKKSLKSSKKK
ncbi:MAG: hypothetical protein PHN56_04535 [Candidatus Nanoarchaeia archaeon]|nr:hypothetical protein [Candidatus Nanoarchaeia archaeon]